MSECDVERLLAACGAVLIGVAVAAAAWIYLWAHRAQIRSAVEEFKRIRRDEHESNR